LIPFGTDIFEIELGAYFIYFFLFLDKRQKSIYLSFFNLLQRLAYLGISAILPPVQMITGLLYYLYNDIPQVLPLSVIAVVHTLVALFLLNFIVIHLYMTTTGHSLFSHIAGRITGWEEVYDTTDLEDWETKATKK